MKKVILKFVLIIACLSTVFVLLGIICSAKLQATSYTVQIREAQGDVKIALLSDLHDRKFGEGNTKLVELLKEQKPDIILLAGDLFDRNSSEKEIAQVCEFLSQLPAVAPSYFSIGNHEDNYITVNGDAVLDRIRETGVTVLECEYEDLVVNGTAFRLGGMSELAYKGGDGKFDPKAEAFLTEYCDTELPTVLMSHRPEAFCFKDACSFWDVDLVLSGHTHGGLARLPKIGGLVAPIQGLFPRFYYGEYDMFNTRVIITSGLAGYYWAPRMFNPPEICVVTLTAKG